ncbi:MAG: T9SS type A sorting domain-containing protein, partial [Candidatus Nomurabacteria bacterium]|nr:T9SS type A sorting domain-containing protein [Candidatus Nomurabacteria bacterium]
NPFNATTTIHYSLTQPGHVRLAIYSITGQKVINMFNTSLPIGNYQTQYDGRDEYGNKVSSGVYIIRLIAGNRFLSKCILYMK